MKFGTINGNAAQAHDLALSILTGQPGACDDFLRTLAAARVVRYRHTILRFEDSYCFPDADYSHPEWWDSGLLYSAGAGIDIAAGLQHSTGSNQNEPV